MKSILGVLTLATSLFLLQGCEDLAECVFGVNPQINNKRLATGQVDQDYYEVITGQVDNDAFDNRYVYNFDVYGDIPPGLFIDFDRRSVEIYGVPEEAGRYTFTVELFVELFDEDGYDGSPTCDEYDEKRFTILVLE